MKYEGLFGKGGVRTAYGERVERERPVQNKVGEAVEFTITL